MQGFNMGRYVPPDVEGTTSANKLHKKHALGQRASKLSSQGILTVRFEMPFPIWCSSCPKPTIIGQGVRFNAEKKRVGNYYTTPVWSFRFKHADCGGGIEMRTDPKNTAYVVVSGAKKRDTGEEVVGVGGVKEGKNGAAAAESGDNKIFLTEGERLEQRKNAFASLEKTIEDREALKQATRRIDGLRDLSARQWDDPYAQNQKLRRAFRAGRKEREKAAAAMEDLKDRMSLGIEIVPETQEDARRAALIDFGAVSNDDDDDVRHDNATLSKPLFASASASTPASSSSSTISLSTTTAKTTPGRLKSEKKAMQRKENLVSELMSNTRAAQDPFLQNNSRSNSDGKTPRLVLGVKRKRAEVDAASSSPSSPSAAAAAAAAAAVDMNVNTSTRTSSAQAATISGALVAYDSD